MQESIIVNLDGNKDEWAHLGVLWKLTPGRPKFMLGGGNVMSTSVIFCLPSAVW